MTRPHSVLQTIVRILSFVRNGGSGLAIGNANKAKSVCEQLMYELPL